MERWREHWWERERGSGKWQSCDCLFYFNPPPFLKYLTCGSNWAFDYTYWSRWLWVNCEDPHHLTTCLLTLWSCCVRIWWVRLSQSIWFPYPWLTKPTLLGSNAHRPTTFGSSPLFVHYSFYFCLVYFNWAWPILFFSLFFLSSSLIYIAPLPSFIYFLLLFYLFY